MQEKQEYLRSSLADNRTALTELVQLIEMDKQQLSKLKYKLVNAECKLRLIQTDEERFNKWQRELSVGEGKKTALVRRATHPEQYAHAVQSDHAPYAYVNPLDEAKSTILSIKHNQRVVELQMTETKMHQQALRDMIEAKQKSLLSTSAHTPASERGHQSRYTQYVWY